jgi:Amt family ammonium transporter
MSVTAPDELGPDEPGHAGLADGVLTTNLVKVVVSGGQWPLGKRVIERLKIDDAVGAFPVHGVCGVWGGIAAAIFGGKPFMAQLIGSIAIPLWAFVMAFILFSILKSIKMLRVSPEEEMEGLDISEHGARAYSPMSGASASGD